MQNLNVIPGFLCSVLLQLTFTLTLTTEHNPLIAHWFCDRPDSAINKSLTGLEGSTVGINCI